MEYIEPLANPGPVVGGLTSYRDRNIGAGIKGSIPSSKTAEHVMRELVNLIEAAGLVPDEGDLTQVEQAVNALITANGVPDATELVKGKAELATQAETDAGLDDARIVTPLKFVTSLLGVARTYTKPQRAARLAVAYAASLTLDFALAQNFIIGDLTGNITLNNPSNVVIDQCGVIVLKQDGTGGRQLALGTNFVTEDDEPIEIATGAAQETHLRYWNQTTTRIVLTPILNPS